MHLKGEEEKKFLNKSLTEGSPVMAHPYGRRRSFLASTQRRLPHHHYERYQHQGEGNGFLMPLASQENVESQWIRFGERLGDLLQLYYYKTAWVC